MPDLKPLRMTVVEFLPWAIAQPEGRRYELAHGEVIAMAPEKNRHVIVKQEAWLALREGIRTAGVDCIALTDGVTVIVDDLTAYEPDVTVQCGADLDLDAVTADRPVIVVEVLSPATQGVDAGSKLADYFRIPSVQHYLMIDPAKRRAIHHARTGEDTIATRVLTGGEILLDPPGIALTLEGLFPEE